MNQGREEGSQGFWRMPGRRSRQAKTNFAPKASQKQRLIEATGALEAGNIVGGRFEIVEQIAVGGMSLVFKATDIRRGGETVALKFLSPALLTDQAAVKRFEAEAKLASRLAHPGILQAYDLHHDQGLYFIHMELLNGVTLRDWIDERRSAGEPIALDDICALLKALCSTLEYAHKTIVHQDIKPENIGIGPDFDIKLMDFGLATLTRSPSALLFRETVAQVNAGTPYYLAPELLDLTAKPDPLSDQYSLAVVAFELLTGDLPLGLGARLSARRPDLPLRFSRAIERALSYRPSERFQRLSEFSREVTRGARPENVFVKATRRFMLASIPVRACLILALCLPIILPFLSFLDDRKKAQLLEFESFQTQRADVLARLGEVRNRIGEFRLEREFLSNQLIRLKNQEETVIDKEGSMTLSNRWHSFDAAWQALRPRLNSDGDLLELQSVARAAERAGARREFREAATRHEALIKMIGTEIRRLAQLPEAFSMGRQLEGLRQIPGHAGEFVIDDPAASRKLEDLLLSADWESALAQVKKNLADGMSRFDHFVAELRAQFDNERLLWNEYVNKDLPYSELSFIADFNETERQATVSINGGEFEEAIRLLQDAVAKLKGWRQSYERMQEDLSLGSSQSSYQIDVMGIRFVRVKNLYWSIHEIRYIDLGRWLSDNMEILDSITKALNLKDEDIDPFFPVTGLDRRTSGGIANWFGFAMNDMGLPTSRLPTIEDWEALMDAIDVGEKLVYGILSVQSLNRLIVFRDYYMDPALSRTQYLSRVGADQDPVKGIFGLSGNAWEWVQSDLDLPERADLHLETSKKVVVAGGIYGQHRFGDSDPPRANLVFVTNPGTIGFRIVIEPNAQLDALSGWSGSKSVD